MNNTEPKNCTPEINKAELIELASAKLALVQNLFHMDSGELTEDARYGASLVLQEVSEVLAQLG